MGVSWVIRWGIPFVLTKIFLTLHNCTWLLRHNTMNSKETLRAIDQTVILSGLVNTDKIHNTRRVSNISLDLAINIFSSTELYIDS